MKVEQYKKLIAYYEKKNVSFSKMIYERFFQLARFNRDYVTKEFIDIFVEEIGDINKKCSTGQTIMESVTDIEIIKYAISKGFDITRVYKSGFYEIKPVVGAMLYNQKVLEFCVKNGFDLNKKNEHGSTIFHQTHLVPKHVLEKAIELGFDEKAVTNQGYSVITELEKLD